jgi:hypothetical protein
MYPSTIKQIIETILKNLLKYKLVGTNHLEKLKMANLYTMQHTRQAKDLKLMQEMLMGRSSLNGMSSFGYLGRFFETARTAW